MLRLLGIVFLISLGCCPDLFAQDSYKQKIEQIIQKYRIPGISLAYLDADGQWISIAVGKLNADTTLLVDNESIFSAASLSKPVTAYIALRLVEQGKLELDRPFHHYFEYEDLSSKAGYRQVTPRMVLTHTSGLPNWRPNRGGNIEFKHPPETEFGYSGEGFVWLQKTIESIEEKPFEEVAHDLVFGPLQMERTSFIWEERFGWNFAFAHDMLMFPSGKWTPTQANAAASLQTNASDYSKFLRELLASKFLSQELRDAMISKQILVDSFKGGKEQVLWGLGVALQETEDGLEFWHWGNNGNIRGFFTVSPSLKKGLVYFSNSKNGLAMTEELTNLFLGTSQPGYKWNGFKSQGKLYRLASMFRKKNK